MTTPVTTSTRPRSQIPGGFGAGVGAAIAMMLVMALLRFTTNTISIPELMEESLVRLTGGRIESYFINALGVGGKALLLVSIVEGTLLLGGILGLAFTYLWPIRRTGGRWLSGLLYGLVVGALLNLVVLPLFNQGFFGANAEGVTAPPDISQALYGTTLAPFGVPVALSMFILSIVFGLTLVSLLRWRTHAATVSATANPAAMPQVNINAPASAVGRRDFVKGAGGTAAAFAGGAALWFLIREGLTPPPNAAAQPVDDPTPSPNQAAAGQGKPSPGPTHDVEMGPTPEMTEGPAPAPVPPGFEGVKPILVPETTPVSSFYITTKNFVDPTVDGNSWKLDFKGLVDAPFSITLKDLKAMPPMDRIETLACISNSVGGSLIGNATWKGVAFADLLGRAKPKAGVVDVVVRGADGYSDSFPLDVALKNECFLAYEMNGQPLTQKHGFPARLLVPNIYGMKNCKWITSVELVNNDFKGYWESQGWDDVAHYQTVSRIDYPDKDRIDAKPLYIGGIAFAGNRGVKKVEVSTDNGKTWAAAKLRPASGKYTWVQWTYPWKPAAGVYTLKVRATDGTGALQTAQVADTFPNGATGYHTKAVRVS